ncbi:MAG: hypothetical protein O2923_10735 [Verrucomicrobia bacterium]|nr:hypothetical protein [Verrucomicrobiota bacterium]MDA1085909.1 hypothetical protein [Verrucomicrobiota bacterium]
MQRWSLLISGIACLVLISGCGCPRKSKKEDDAGPVASKIAEKLMEHAIKKSADGDADVQIKDGKLQIKTAEGETTLDYGEGKFEIQSDEGKFSMLSGENAKIPEGFPDELQPYDGAKVVQVITHEKGAMLGTETDDSADDVFAHYQERFVADGWTEQSSVKMPAMKMLIYQKDDATVTINVVPYEGKTRVQQTLTRDLR